jgi:hypothetical protein
MEIDDNFEIDNDLGVGTDITSSILPMGDDEFSALMKGGTPPKPAAPKKDSTPQGKQGSKTPAAAAPTQTPDDDDSTDIDAVDIDDLYKPKKGAKGTKPAAKTAVTGEEGTDDTDTEDTDTTDTTDEGEEMDEESAKAVLSSTYRHLVDNGLWQEVEGDEFDPENITPDQWAEIAVEQATAQAHAAFDELMNRTGKYRAILDHALKNGDPDKIIDLFKEEQVTKAADITTEAGQETMVRRYYKNLLEWDDSDIESTINKLKADKELEKYAKIAQNKYQAHIDKSITAEETQRKQNEKKVEARKQQYAQTMSSAIAQLNLPADSKRFLQKSLLQPTPTKIGTETKSLTPYQAQMMKIQSSPADMLDLLQFVMDKKGYISRVKTQKQNVKNQNSFRIKLNGSSTSGKSGGVNPATRKQSREEETENIFL